MYLSKKKISRLLPKLPTLGTDYRMYRNVTKEKLVISYMARMLFVVYFYLVLNDKG